MAGRPRAADALSMTQVLAVIRWLRADERIRDAALVAVGAGYGLRISDALSLTWDDLLDSAGRVRPEVTFTEQKTGKRRTLRTLPFVAKAVQDLYASAPGSPGDRLFTITRQAAWGLLKRIAVQMDLREHVSTHSLRKAFCSFVYEQSNDPVLTARVTGHSNPAELLRYIQRVPAAEAEVWSRMAKGLAKLRS